MTRVVLKWTILWAVLAGIIVSVVAWVHPWNDVGTEKRMEMDTVVNMLIKDGMAIHTVAPATTTPFAHQNVDILFDDGASRIDAGILTFDSLDARKAWLGVSQTLGGVAVVRNDELWAVSVDSDLPNSVDIAQRLAHKIKGEAVY